MSDAKWVTLNGARYPIDECGQLDESRISLPKTSNTTAGKDKGVKGDGVYERIARRNAAGPTPGSGWDKERKRHAAIRAERVQRVLLKQLTALEPCTAGNARCQTMRIRDLRKNYLDM